MQLTKMQCTSAGDAWRCECQCGYVATLPQKMAWHACETSQVAKQQHAAISPLQKIANFAASTARHLAAGAPRCTQEQIDARFAICQTCEHFDGKACRQCGCPVARERQFVSKLSWAGEKCPAGKWGPVEPPAG